MKDPVPFSDEIERPEPDEAETTRQLVETLLKISTTVVEHEKHARRAVHAKSHALLLGTLSVADGLDPSLAQGLFTRPGNYNAVLRFSSTPGDSLTDSVSTPRGLAIKVYDVPGPALPDSPGRTQDFVFINGPAFAAPDARHFLKNLKLLASTTDKVPGLKAALSGALRETERLVEALGGESSTLKALGGHPATHPLGETYFTQVPLRYGDFIAKLRVRPTAEALTALHHQPIDITHSPNALREAMREFFRSYSGDWVLEAQLCRDVQRMPVEDASVVWPEDLSPFQPVAALHVAQQDAWPPNAAEAIEDSLAFSPWHGLQAHRPLGSVMRARKACYDASARFRAAHNGVTIAESNPLSDRCPHPG